MRALELGGNEAGEDVSSQKSPQRPIFLAIAMKLGGSRDFVLGTANCYFLATQIRLWEHCGPLSWEKTGQGKPGEAKNLPEHPFSRPPP